MGTGASSRYQAQEEVQGMLSRYRLNARKSSRTLVALVDLSAGQIERDGLPYGGWTRGIAARAKVLRTKLPGDPLP